MVLCTPLSSSLSFLCLIQAQRRQFVQTHGVRTVNDDDVDDDGETVSASNTTTAIQIDFSMF
jgi:hypothetical protein